MLARPDAIKALNRDSARHLVLRCVLLVRVLAGRFSHGDFRSVPQDTVFLTDRGAFARRITAFYRNAAFFEVLPHIHSVQLEGVVVIQQDTAAPVRRFVVTDHMRHCPSVFVVDEVKGNGLCKRELRHLCLIKHAAARVFKPVTELGRADVGQEVKLPLFALNGGGVAGKAAQLSLLRRPLLAPLFQNRGNDDKRQNACADSDEINADAASVPCDRGIIRIVKDGGLPSDFGVPASHVQLAGIGLTVHGVFHRRIVIGVVAARIHPHRNHRTRGFHEALRLEKGGINADA